MGYFKHTIQYLKEEFLFGWLPQMQKKMYIILCKKRRQGILEAICTSTLLLPPTWKNEETEN